MAPIGGVAQPPRKEETLWQGTPSITLLLGHFAGIVLVLVAVPLLALFFASTMPDDLERASGMRSFGWWATAIIVFAQLIALAVAWIRLRSTMYRVTNQRVLVEQGVFSKTVDEIDLRYVDDSTFTQTFFDRILGIGSVTLMSSDTNTPRYVLRSIKDPRGVREMIRAEAYQSSQRQVFTRVT
ncbi:MAG TPA: PH domain-containing protein [Thermoanaerobaculia bacterium]|jgi:uncharacterized membrane protein YdbT with pleckstrin-like domain|nr:PH domain-containing protein [Thermoanaerobaculia bacterium]